MSTVYKVEATDNKGRKQWSWHASEDEAKRAAAEIRGQYPWGNRIKVLRAPCLTVQDNPERGLRNEVETGRPY